MLPLSVLEVDHRVLGAAMALIQESCPPRQVALGYHQLDQEVGF